MRFGRTPLPQLPGGRIGIAPPAAGAGGSGGAGGAERPLLLDGDATGATNASVVERVQGVPAPVPGGSDAGRYWRYTGSSYELARLYLAVRSVAASATATTDDDVLLADASAGALVVALPPAASAAGKLFVVKKVDGSANAVTVDPDGAETIDGAATFALSAPQAFVAIVSDGAGWRVIGN